MRKYELMLVIQPELADEAVTALVERYQQTITEHAGEVLKAERMGLHRLAYIINGKQQAHYVLIQANLSQEGVVELERALKLSEDLLRHLLTRVEEAA